MRRIQILPDRLVNQIAAGEVVERPASVVKELVENALDAGAKRVEVSIRNGGKTEIRVSDDGHGMGREDALLALDRHATSKIRDVEDLDSVRTLGFRGEALPSISSVSRLTLETAERDRDGTRILVNAGKISTVEPCARRRGTTVQVRNLFHNVPARAKFLRSAAAETRAIAEVVTTLTLAHPEVEFVLESNGRELLQLSSVPEVRGRIGEIWGDEFAGQLVPATRAEAAVSVSGWVQRPANASPGSRRAYLFVNGRSFTDRYLLRAADRGYDTTIPRGARASLFLFLDIPEGQVDVNVHPTKAEVRFRDKIGVERGVEETVRGALRTLASAPGVARAPAAWPARAPERPQLKLTPEPAPPQPAGPAAEQMALFMAGREPDAPAEQLDEYQQLTTGTMWQVHSTYIFAQTRDGLIVVDQHSAHERVLYEQMMTEYATRPPPSQKLLFPITLRLAPAELNVVEELSGILAHTGFEIELFGGRAVVVHAVPCPHPHFDAERCLREMIGELAEGSPLVDSARNQHQRVLLSFACKAAIKAGQKLSAEEMGELFDRLFATELPYHDIHGRPTVVQLSLAELHSRFRRGG